MGDTYGNIAVFEYTVNGKTAARIVFAGQSLSGIWPDGLPEGNGWIKS